MAEEEAPHCGSWQEKKWRREEEAFQDGCLLDREVTDDLRARVQARETKDAANARQRHATPLRRKLRVAMLSRPVPWSKFAGLEEHVWTTCRRYSFGPTTFSRR